MLKPTIKIIGQINSASVSGTVTNDADPSEVLEGVLISVQSYNDTAADAKDAVSVITTTLTDADGGYELTLGPGSYTIVATKEGYASTCSKITVVSGASQTLDMVLSVQSGSGTLTGTANIVNGAEDRTATLSIRQGGVCVDLGADEMVEVGSVNISDGGTYNLTLPEGTYQLVAYSDSFDTFMVESLDVTADQATTQDISFAQ